MRVILSSSLFQPFKKKNCVYMCVFGEGAAVLNSDKRRGGLMTQKHILCVGCWYKIDFSACHTWGLLARISRLRPAFRPVKGCADKHVHMCTCRHLSH